MGKTMKIKEKPITNFTPKLHKRFDYKTELGIAKSVKVFKADWEFTNIMFDDLDGQLEYELELDENEQVISISKIESITERQDNPAIPKPSQPTTDSTESRDSMNEAINYTDKCEVVAYNCAKQAIHLRKDYKNHAKSLPMMIRANGLGATLAFLKSKDDTYYQKLYEQLGKYLQTKNTKLSGEVADAILNCTSQETKELTKEALTFLGWLRRFAEGLIKV